MILETSHDTDLFHEGNISSEVATQQFRGLAPHTSCLFTWEQQHEFDDASCAGHGRASLTLARKTEVTQFLRHFWVLLLNEYNAS